MIVSGSSHPSLAQDIAHHMDEVVAEVEISKFPNGEKRVWVKSDLKDKIVCIVQSFSEPVDEHIIELSLLADAAKHSGAKKIIGVIPWLGYSPQDKLFRPGEPISVHVIARIIAAVGVEHVVVLDVHSQEALKHFTVKVTEVSALPIFTDYFRARDLSNHVVVALDKGAAARAHEFAKALDLPTAQFEKTRDRETGAVSFNSLAGDVASKHVISFDDFVSTGSTRIEGSKLLKEKGALSYTDCVTHALLTGTSPKKLQESSIDQLLTTDTYPIPKEKHFPKLRVLPVAPLLAKALKPLL